MPDSLSWFFAVLTVGFARYTQHATAIICVVVHLVSDCLLSMRVVFWLVRFLDGIPSAAARLIREHRKQKDSHFKRQVRRIRA